MKSSLLLGILVLLSGSSALASPCGEIRPEWSTCSRDSECVVEQEACYFQAAFRKEHLERVQKYNACIRPMIRCAPAPKEDAERTQAACVSGFCEAVRPGGQGVPHAHDFCIRDTDCVPITMLNHSCRHVDPKATEVCPSVNRKYAEELGMIDCAESVPCRAATEIRCESSRCVSR